MKNALMPTLVLVVALSAWSLGQARRPVEPCCCKHMQQLADDVHWMREKMSKPYVPPKIPDIGPGRDFKPIEPIELDTTIDTTPIKPVDLNKHKVPKYTPKRSK